MLEGYFQDAGWIITHTDRLPSREGQRFDIGDLPLSAQSRQLLQQTPFCGSLYGHQKEVIRCALTGQTSLSETGISFDLSYFTRRYFTTGVLLTHPILSQPDINVEAISNIIYESCLLIIPFEGRDIGYASDRHRAERKGIQKDSKFIVIFDRTYGSLRISGRFVEDTTLAKVFQTASDICHHDRYGLSMNNESKGAIETICSSLNEDAYNFSFDDDNVAISSNSVQRIQIIRPGSKGINIHRNNEEFMVKKVSFHPSIENGQRLSYAGRHISTGDETVIERIPVSYLVEIPGVSLMGFYNYDTEEIED